MSYEGDYSFRKKVWKRWRYPGVPIQWRLQSKYKDFSLKK